MGEGLWQASRCLHNLKKALYAFSTGEVTRNAAGSRYPSVEARSEFLDTGRHTGTNPVSVSALAMRRSLVHFWDLTLGPRKPGRKPGRRKPGQTESVSCFLVLLSLVLLSLVFLSCFLLSCFLLSCFLCPAFSLLSLLSPLGLFRPESPRSPRISRVENEVTVPGLPRL